MVFPVAMAVLGPIQTDLSGAPYIFKVSCLDIVVPGIFSVPIEVIVIHFRLKACCSANFAGCSITRVNEREGVDYT